MGTRKVRHHATTTFLWLILGPASIQGVPASRCGVVTVMAKSKMTPEILAALQEAFPGGYMRLDSTRTIGGYFCFHIPGTGFVWFLPKGNQFTKVGNRLFDEEKTKLTLLPDVTHYPTYMALLTFMAEKVNTPTEQGLRWYPATRGKRLVGWCLQGRGSAKTFQGIEAKDAKLALLETLAMLRCRCAEKGRRNCPQHGTRKCWT